MDRPIAQTSRFSLRKQRKIASVYGDKFLKRLINSLNEAFKTTPPEIKEIEGEPYPVIEINDEGHTCGMIIFYVVRRTFDVYNLAFKEVIN